MIAMEMFGEIRRMPLPDKLALHEITKEAHRFVAQHATKVAENAGGGSGANVPQE